jgi:prepilin-type N-terminal cleavage/methylation domain-containing protein
MTTPARRGMTLMELVVGLAITGMMAAMGGAAFGSIIDHRRALLASTADVERAAALRDQIRTWILSGTVQIETGGVPQGMGRAGAAAPAAPVIQSGSVAGAAPAGGLVSSSTAPGSATSAAVASGDELTFITTAPNPADAPSVRMRLFIDADPSTPETGLTLEYQASTSAPLMRVELEPSIGALKVEFLDQRTNQWFESTQAAAITPIAVRLSMQPPEGGHLPGILELPMVFPMGSLLTGR